MTLDSRAIALQGLEGDALLRAIQGLLEEEEEEELQAPPATVGGGGDELVERVRRWWSEQEAQTLRARIQRQNEVIMAVVVAACTEGMLE